MLQTVDWFEENLKIDRLDICDHLEWNPYAFAEGLANGNTEVKLSDIEIAKLSPLTANEIQQILNEHKESEYSW